MSQTLGAVKKGYAYDTPLGGFPTMDFIVGPAAGSATAVRAAVTLTADTQEITGSITHPDTPRALSITGNASGIVGDVTIIGRDWSGQLLKEVITASGTGTITGNFAFAKVDKIIFPAKTNVSGDTISVGTTNKLGLKRPVKVSGDYVLLEVNGTAEAFSATAPAYDTFTPTTAPNGSRVFKVYYHSYAL